MTETVTAVFCFDPNQGKSKVYQIVSKCIKYSFLETTWRCSDNLKFHFISLKFQFLLLASRAFVPPVPCNYNLSRTPDQNKGR